MAHELPPLPYDYTALEPTIDEKTMHLHHDMHHAAYVKNLNAALDKHPELHKKSAEDLIRDLNSVPEDIRGAVRHCGRDAREQAAQAVSTRPPLCCLLSECAHQSLPLHCASLSPPSARQTNHLPA